MKHFHCLTTSKKKLVEALRLAVELGMVPNGHVACGCSGKTLAVAPITVRNRFSPKRHEIVGFNVSYDMPHLNRGHVTRGCVFTFLTAQDYRLGNYFNRRVRRSNALGEMKKFNQEFGTYITNDYTRLHMLKSKYGVRPEGEIKVKTDSGKKTAKVVKFVYSYTESRNPWLIQTDLGYASFSDIAR